MTTPDPSHDIFAGPPLLSRAPEDLPGELPRGAQVPDDLDPLADGILMQHQVDWIADKSDLKLAEKGRRTGITFGEALDDTLTAASKRSAGGDNVFYIGDTKDKGREFIGYVAKFAKAIGEDLAAIEEFLFEDQKADGSTRMISAFRIRFASGYRVEALSSRPENIRGLQGIVVIDEAAFHQDVRGVLDAVNALLIWGGKIRVISTHNGVLNPFNELIREARAGYFPTLSIGVTSRVSRFSAADQDLDGNVRDRGVEYDSDALLTVQQNIYDGGATVNQVKVAKAATRVEAASSTEGLSDLAIRAIESWHDVLRERMRHELALRQLAAHKTILARVTLRYERGAAPVTDLARAEARLADARATVITREAGLEIAIQNYVEAYGETPGEVGFVRFTELVPASVTDALDQARGMNASLIRAQAERDQAEANLRVAQSAYYPQIQLEGNAVQFDIWDNREYGVTGRLIASYPIFEGGARSARNDRAKANLAQAQFQQSAISRAIDRDVRVTWERVQALGRRLVTQEKALRANEEARALIREQFGFGGRSLFDLLEAERDVFTAADQYLSSRIDFEVSRFELAAVTGVLLNMLDVSVKGGMRDEPSEDAPQPSASDDF